MWKDFKKFAFRGNVLDMAIGVIIATAFGKIVSSVVNDIFMPLISRIIGFDFTNWFVALDGGEYATLQEATDAGASILHYGNLISVIVDFLIIAFFIFMVVRLINKAKNRAKKEAEEAPKPEPRLCPYCFTEINEKATRCPHCTSELEAK
ncbi:MAG: large conductance mechanosensitive channel protein MscL [Clostridia bacterium]|nr:large conductance mechanosensitive channel protein MscL [Clostridia bacterium]